MRPARQDSGTGRRTSELVKPSVRAQRERPRHRSRGVHTIAGPAPGRDEFTGPLTMQGLDEGHGSGAALSRSLGGYVRQVAVALGVPAEAVGYEVSDTATAYLGLDTRSPSHVGRDLMLVWDERFGWYLAVETHPGETPFVLGYLGGDAVPSPASVARFVAEAVASRRTGGLRPVQPLVDRITTARRMLATCPAAQRYPGRAPAPKAAPSH